jgi:hypothetical protein
VRRGVAALAALLVALALAAPAGAATRREEQLGAFTVPAPTAPIRDLVIEHPSRSEARAAASASAASQRYDVHDGAGRSVDIQPSPGCSATCTNPQQIADFLGTLPHGDEMNLLTVDEVNPSLGEMAAYCGDVSALSCYFPSENRMVASGHDFTAGDNATRDYVVAHEYGHHLANHRNNAPFANPAIDWGPKRWASFAGVCPGVRAGRYFPGDEGAHYYDNPGEAFAESFAKYAFPTQPVPWEWPAFPDPHQPGGFDAIRQDALQPWNGDSADRRNGRFARKRKRHKRVSNRKVKRFTTPNDGNLTMTLKGPNRADLALKLKGADGRTLARSDGVGSHEQVNFTICGERSFTAVVRRQTDKRKRARFSLTALVP